MDQSPDWIALVESARAGDSAAQSVLVSRFEPLAHSTALRLVPVGLVDDVVQESWAVALERLPGLRTSAAFPSWLRLIVRRQASRLRAPTREEVFDPTGERWLSDDDPAQQASRRETARIVRLALNAARDQDRRVLELRYLAGWSNDEIADLLGINAGTVRKRLFDARRRLRPDLDQLNPKEKAMTDYSQYLGAVHNATLDVPPATTLVPSTDGATVTGLKVVDALAPVRRGGTIEMTGPAGTGQVVVALEILWRIGRSERDVACVGVGRTGAQVGSQPDLSHIVTEDGIPGPCTVVLSDTPGDAAPAFTAGCRLAAGLAHQGLDVVMVVDRPTIVALDRSTLAGCSGLSDEGSVTLVALNTLDGSSELPSLELDTTLVFSLEHLVAGIFPAIDGAESTSTLGISETAQTAKKRLQDAATLRSWFHQPMYVAQPFTGDDGTWIEPASSDAGLSSLTR